MKIENIHINSFGKLNDLSIDLLDGINLIEGENESGKSTICAFIKFIFFGLSNKAEKGAISERAKYLSWNERECSGNLTLLYDGKRYRVTHTLVLNARGTQSEEVQIVDLDTNTAIVDSSPADMFIGVPEEVFVRSCFVSQTDSGKVGGADIREAIENILFSADETTNTKKALKKIDDARVELLYKNKKGGLIYDLKNREESLYLRLKTAREAAIEIEEKKKLEEDTLRTISEKEEKSKYESKRIHHTDALRRLNAIDKMKNAGAKLDKAAQALSQFKDENTFEGYMPDRAFCAATASAASEYRFVCEELDRTKESINETETQLDVLDTPLNSIEPNEIMTQLNYLALHRRVRIAFIFAFLFIGAALAAAGVFFSERSRTLGIGLLAGAGALIIAALVLFIVNLCARRKRKMLLLSCECQNERELPGILKCISDDKTKSSELEGTLRFLYEKKASLHSKQTAIFNSCADLLARWGKKCENEDDMLSASLEAGKVADKFAELSSERSSCEDAYNSVKIDYSDEEEASLRSLLSSDGIDGELSPDEYTEAVRQRDFAATTAAMLRDRSRENARVLADMTARAESPEALESELSQVQDEEKKQLARYEALMLAYEKLAESSEALRERISPTLSKSASRFMGSATDGKYSTIGVDSSLELEYTSEDSINRDVAYMSAGTKDLAYLSLRLALADMLLSEKKPPIIMDESFVRQDEKRLRASLNSVASFCDEGYQVLMLTSQGRDAKALGAIREFNHIKL